MKDLSRRWFLWGGATALGAAAWPALFARSTPRADPAQHATPHDPGLIPDPDGILDLPEGFSYRVLERSGTPMDDGYRMPGMPDGMACFVADDGDLVLMRNHELSPRGVRRGPYRPGQPPAALSYRPECVGGVSRLVLDPHTFERRSSNLVLVGTMRNCAGGPSPWGWLSCEESSQPHHGYVFLCSPDATEVAAPQRLDNYGRFVHEAVAIDPRSAMAYMTEDRSDGCLYRFVPDDVSRPFEGRLQALKAADRPAFDTGTGLSVGQQLPVEWVDLPRPDSIDDDLRHQATALGAARIVRGEGIWYADDAAYFCSTSGGPMGRGQIFQLALGQHGDGDVLTLVAQADDTKAFKHPDNITVAPWGDLYVAEDGGGDQYLRVIDAQGVVRPFARNAISRSEFAGVCFSPDGAALFVNIQHDGLTLAVTGAFGPWRARQEQDKA